jgi:hypothetical protein
MAITANSPTRPPSQIDIGDQFLDTASQSLAQWHFALAPKYIIVSFALVVPAANEGSGISVASAGRPPRLERLQGFLTIEASDY